MAFKKKILTTDYPNILNRLKTGETYQSIGDSYNVTRERIRQIAKKNSLQGVGLGIRSKDNHKKWLSKMGRIYGEFFDGGEVHERDLLTECKDKFRTKKYNAVKSGIDFSIEFQDVVWNKICPILGISIDYFAEGRCENSPSFDRTNPELGYIKGNVQIISWRANQIKNDGTQEEHQKVADYMSNTRQSIESDDIIDVLNN